LIDYQTHMHIIGTNLANYIVFALLAQRVKALSIESDRLAKEKNSFKLIHILHHLTAGFKSMVTQYTYKGIDELRQACGGAGFLLASGIARVWGDFAPNITYEGVNVVMMQQSSKFLLK